MAADGGRRLAPLAIDDDAERSELMSLAAPRSTALALAFRSRIVLRCATGEQSK
jgi:hypothetical protein